MGLVLGAKAAAQLLSAPLAGAAVCRRGAAPVLRAATAALALAALGDRFPTYRIFHRSDRYTSFLRFERGIEVP